MKKTNKSSNRRVVAINEKYKDIVHNIVAWNIKYNAAVDEESICDTDREVTRCQKKQARAYDKLYELFQTLPAREKENIRKNISTLRNMK